MDFPLPELGEGVYEAELVQWFVREGDTVKRAQPLLEVLTDKATREVPSPFAGQITKVFGQPGTKIKVGQLILTYQPSGSKAEATTPTPEVVAPSASATLSVAPAPKASNGTAIAPPSIPRTTVAAAPSVRHMARKLGIDLARVRGTGPGGRVLIDDLSAHVSRKPTEKPHPSETTMQEYGRPGTRVKLLGVRRTIAEHLVEAKRRIPHYAYVDECDVSELVRLRNGMREACAKIGIRLTYLPFFLKAVAEALKEVPIVNSSLDDAAEEIVLHDRYHIGFAVATPTGLVVPVVRDADKLDVFGIASEVDRLANDCRNGRVKRDDLRGGTFTVTSIGSIGGLISTPIINHPEVGIMGVGKVVRRPVYDDAGNLKPADLLYLSFSFDHRVVDGAVGAIFGNAVKSRLENPAALLVPHRR